MMGIIVKELKENQALKMVATMSDRDEDGRPYNVRALYEIITLEPDDVDENGLTSIEKEFGDNIARKLLPYVKDAVKKGEI